MCGGLELRFFSILYENVKLQKSHKNSKCHTFDCFWVDVYQNIDCVYQNVYQNIDCVYQKILFSLAQRLHLHDFSGSKNDLISQNCKTPTRRHRNWFMTQSFEFWCYVVNCLEFWHTRSFFAPYFLEFIQNQSMCSLERIMKTPEFLCWENRTSVELSRQVGPCFDKCHQLRTSERSIYLIAEQVWIPCFQTFPSHDG